MLAMQMLYQLSHIPNPSAHCDGVLVQKIGLKLQQGILGDISIRKSGGVIVVTETSFAFSVPFTLPFPISLLYISIHHQATLYHVYLKAVFPIHQLLSVSQASLAIKWQIFSPFL